MEGEMRTCNDRNGKRGMRPFPECSRISLDEARSRLKANIVAVYSSLLCAANAKSLARTTRKLMTTPTKRNAPNVIRYSESDTRNVNVGGTKKKSNASTLIAAVNIAGRKPQLIAATTTPMRKSITTLVGDMNVRMNEHRMHISRTSQRLYQYGFRFVIGLDRSSSPFHPSPLV